VRPCANQGAADATIGNRRDRGLDPQPGTRDVTLDETTRGSVGEADQGLENPAGGRRRFGVRRPAGFRTVRAAVARVVALVAGGALIGYVASSFVSAFVAGGTLTGRPAEPTETRAYLDALVAGDTSRLEQLQPPSDLGTRAAQLQQGGSQHWTTQARSYLGGATLGPVGVYVYVIDVKNDDGSIEQAVPFAFTVVEKKIVRVQ
jgi:hypothetical protein